MIRIEQVMRDEHNFIAISRESPFYPDGKGGQLGDRGKIGGLRVLKVEERQGLYLHYLDGELEPGEYEYEIDLERRKDIACQHTAQHILSASFLKVADLETMSFHMGEEYSTIDLNAPFVINEVIEEAEDLANEVVRKCLKVEILTLGREGSERLNLRKPVSEKAEGEVRIVKIGDFDVTPCGGFHVENTGNIGLIKILDREKVKGSLTRVYFVAGKRALRDYRRKNQILRSISSILTTSVEETEKRVTNLLEDVKKAHSKLEKIAEDFAEFLSKHLPREQICDFSVISFKGYEEVGRFLPKFLGDDEKVILVLSLEGKVEVISKGLDCPGFFEYVKRRHNTIKGGGSRDRIVFVGIDPKELMEDLRDFLS